MPAATTYPTGFGWYRVTAFDFEGKPILTATRQRDEARRIAELWWRRPDVGRVEGVKV